MTPQFLKWFADTYPATAAAAERGESGPLRDRRNDWDVWRAASLNRAETSRPAFLEWYASEFPANSMLADIKSGDYEAGRELDWEIWKAAVSPMRKHHPDDGIARIAEWALPKPPPMIDGLGRPVPLVPPTTEYRRVLPGEYDLGMVVFAAVVMAMGFLFGYVARGGGL